MNEKSYIVPSGLEGLKGEPGIPGLEGMPVPQELRDEIMLMVAKARHIERRPWYKEIFNVLIPK